LFSSTDANSGGEGGQRPYSVGLLKRITNPFTISHPHFHLKTKPDSVFEKLCYYKSKMQDQKITREGHYTLTWKQRWWKKQIKNQ
jgi:hypothetical protein